MSQLMPPKTWFLKDLPGERYCPLIKFIYRKLQILAARFPCIWPAKDYKLKNFYLTISSNQVCRYKDVYAKAPKRGKNYQIICIAKNYLALYNLSGLCIRMIVLRMTTIIVNGRQRGHESKEITARPFSGWMCRGIKCY